jgi:serine/threonine protein kinase
VAEHCEQGSLVKIGADRFGGDVRASVEALLPIIDALTAAHQAGVIHRDVKPPNILFRADGTPVLADFGICHMDEDQR